MIVAGRHEIDQLLAQLVVQRLVHDRRPVARAGERDLQHAAQPGRQLTGQAVLPEPTRHVVEQLVAGGRAVWMEDFAGGPLLAFGDLLLLAALPLIGTALATLGARQAVLRALRSAL